MILEGDVPPALEPSRLAIGAPDRAARRSLVDVLARAFRDNPMNARIHGPDPPRRVRANAAGLRSLVLDHSDTVVSRVITYDSGVIGGFIVAPPGTFPLPRPSIRRQFECFWLQGAGAMGAWSAVTASLAQYRPREPHWYLSVLGVEPVWQGRGIGAALLGSIEDLVAASPAPLCLECDRPESVRFYRAHGFEVRAEDVVHGVPCWCLGRGFPSGDSA
ncbi:MAG: GNAT family N-acetyltransferase [bacterium]|nr:GNAT family N-acetyltransferase [bacterium]